MATVRRIRRIITKIDPWTTLKVSAVIWAVLALAFVLGAVIFWAVLDRAGIPDQLVDFMVEITLLEEGADPFANTEQMVVMKNEIPAAEWLIVNHAGHPVHFEHPEIVGPRILDFLRRAA